MKTLTNEMIRLALKKRTVEAAQAALGDTNEFNILLDEEMENSTQGYVTLEYKATGQQLVISKGKDGYTGLFSPYNFIVDNNQLKEFDFINWLETRDARVEKRNELFELKYKENKIDEYKKIKKKEKSQEWWVRSRKEKLENLQKDIEELKLEIEKEEKEYQEIQKELEDFKRSL